MATDFACLRITIARQSLAGIARPSLRSGPPAGFADPVALLHQVSIHLADQRERAAKADGAELQRVKHQLSKRITSVLRRA